ncbi:MAG: 6,7-dimethyl-8-ribityllumazine synthase [Acidimicrobiales bacterium]|jgi:6,7-dimethyl-8-ribityllumazine synthase|nr:6,7-dimethyl-8-ribityllumazine synthase [Acidimicrobiales bacterium]
MATKDVSAVDDTDGSGLRVAVVRTRWNPEIIGRLADGVARTLAGLGVTDVADVEVAGAFEIPFACRTIASSGRVDAIVAIGAVIRGETTHYDIVSEECARGLQDVQIQTGVPIGFGVLATENLTQAEARSEPAGGHNVGADAAQVAVEMALLARDWS